MIAFLIHWSFIYLFRINTGFFEQSVPMFSPLTFTIEGDDNENQIEVGQSAPDDSSPLQVSYTQPYFFTHCQ